MTYKSFKEKDIEDKFGIGRQVTRLFNGDKIQPVQPSARLLESLEDAQLVTLSTEKALSERIISPIIAEVKRLNPDTIQIFSGEILNANPEQGLNGEFLFCEIKLAGSDTGF